MESEINKLLMCVYSDVFAFLRTDKVPKII